MKLTVTNKIMAQGMPEKFKAIVKERLTFSDPKWLENDKRGYWNGKTPKQIKCYEQTDNGLFIPRGYIRHLISLAKTRGIQYRLQDHRRTLPEVDFSFYGKLKSFQKAAVKDILGHDFGTLSAPTGIGKGKITGI